MNFLFAMYARSFIRICNDGENIHFASTIHLCNAYTKTIRANTTFTSVKSQKATKCNFTILLFYCFEEFVESQHLKMLTGGIKIQTLQILQTDKGNFVVLMV